MYRSYESLRDDDHESGQRPGQEDEHRIAEVVSVKVGRVADAGHGSARRQVLGQLAEDIRKEFVVDGTARGAVAQEDEHESSERRAPESDETLSCRGRRGNGQRQQGCQRGYLPEVVELRSGNKCRGKRRCQPRQRGKDDRHSDTRPDANRVGQDEEQY